MKKIQIIFLFLAFLTSSSFMNSCSNSSSQNDKTTQQSIEYASAYICPMYCKGSGSDKPGFCPVCEMDYEKNANYKGAAGTEVQDNHEGHNHDSHEGHDHEGHDHEGHDHDNHEGHNH